MDEAGDLAQIEDRTLTLSMEAVPSTDSSLT